MANIFILYPALAGSHFDADYYLKKHVPMVGSLLGPATGFVSAEVFPGIALPPLTDKAAYWVIARICFDTFESFGKAFSVHGAVILGDLKNFTDVEPVIQLCDNP